MMRGPQDKTHVQQDQTRRQEEASLCELEWMRGPQDKTHVQQDQTRRHEETSPCQLKARIDSQERALWQMK
jgi:hypothetical protein